MQRDPMSHKGENGKVAIVGGSLHQHGAPLMSALAAEAVGSDLLYVALPACHASVARMQSLNLQVHPFHGDDLTKKDLPAIIELLATIDVAVIGPGIARTPTAIAATLDVLSEASCPLVVDATALQPETVKRLQGKTAVLTPHLGELERMGLTMDALPPLTKGAQLVFVVKGPIDHVVADGATVDVAGGNAGLTVGGTGDALAGCIAGLMAQGMTPKDAARMGSTLIKRAGTMLQTTYGSAYTTRRVIEQLPIVLRELP